MQRLVVMLLALAAFSRARADESPAPEATGEELQSIAVSMVDSASRLLASVPVEPTMVEKVIGFSRAGELTHPLESDGRTALVYWPATRLGLELERMTAEQRRHVQALMATALATQGQLKVAAIMQLENVLATTEAAGIPRGMGGYALAIFGTPSLERPWGWRFEGHHVSLNFVVTAGDLSVTPSFLGASPAEISGSALAGFRPLRQEEDLGRELVRSFSGTQRERAILSHEAPADVLSGTLFRNPARGDDWRARLEPDGIAVRALSPAQKRLVQRILDEVMATYRPEIVSAYRQSIDLEDLQFAWMGSVEPRASHYYRLLGRDFVFEYDSVDNGNHIHTLWRSRAGDFGTELLQRHYEEAPHSSR